jgi:hypothetical protein
MNYERDAYKQLEKNLKEIMALSFYGSKDEQEANLVNNLAHECEKIVKKLESNSKKSK